MKDFGINKCLGYKGWGWIKVNNTNNWLSNKEKVWERPAQPVINFSHKKLLKVTKKKREKEKYNSITCNFFPYIHRIYNIWQWK